MDFEVWISKCGLLTIKHCMVLTNAECHSRHWYFTYFHLKFPTLYWSFYLPSNPLHTYQQLSSSSNNTVSFKGTVGTSYQNVPRVFSPIPIHPAVYHFSYTYTVISVIFIVFKYIHVYKCISSRLINNQ